MEEFVVVALIEAQERNCIERARLRSLRDTSNPFTLPNSKFKKLFRIPSTSAKFLIDEIKDFHLFDEGYIPKHLRILAALQFYADGSYQTPVGADSVLSLSQPSTSRAIEATTIAIVEWLAPRYIRFPTSPDDKLTTTRGFSELYNMPNTLGAIDGSHIAIFKPPNNDDDAPGIIFYNRKGFYSINCQVIVNAKGKIISVNANFPGATHDAAVWRLSAVAQHLERDFLRGAEDQWLIGDKGYPLLPWLITPVTEPQNEAEENFNTTHAQARNIVELTFGRLKNKLRCLHKHRTLHYAPKKAAKIIIACCTLYNLFCGVLSDDDVDSEDDNSSTSNDSSSEENDEENDHNEFLDYLTIAREKRASLISNYFT